MGGVLQYRLSQNQHIIAPYFFGQLILGATMYRLHHRNVLGFFFGSCSSYRELEWCLYHNCWQLVPPRELISDAVMQFLRLRTWKQMDSVIVSGPCGHKSTHAAFVLGGFFFEMLAVAVTVSHFEQLIIVWYSLHSSDSQVFLIRNLYSYSFDFLEINERYGQ